MTRTAATLRTLRAARPIGPALVDVVVVSCPCGCFPLDQAMHRTSGQAWQAAADHVALNARCKPSMNRDRVPAGLAANLPAAPEAPGAAFVAVTPARPRRAARAA